MFLKWLNAVRYTLRQYLHQPAQSTPASGQDMRNMAETFKNQGNEHYAKGELELAAAYYQQAIETDPGYANAYNNLGAIHRRQNRPDEALVCYRKALALNPALAKAHYNLGSILAEKGDYAAAANAYKKAIETNPGYAEAHEGLGNVLKDLGQFDDAVASYLRALENKPDYAGAHNNLGIAFQDLGQLDDAVACFAQALKIKPDFAEAHSNLLLALNYVSRGSHLPSLEEALRFGRMVNNNTRTRFTVWPCKTIQPERLRVGLVSGDLLNHPVGYFLESLLPHIDPTRIELIAYSTNRKEDELTIRLKTCFTAWKPLVELSDEAAASAVHADGVHILIDLSGHTAYNRLPLFAWKPAPVQVSWLGYFATTGVEGMDYFIADPWTAPESEESHFTEKIQRLPETYLCFSPPNIKVQVASLPALTDGHITFGCFNNLTKMNDAVVALWARVLQAVPGSRLFLKTRQLGEAAVRQSVSSRFAAHGIAAERLMLEGAAPRAELLAAYRRVDIALDPFPYPGGATSIEALWMGVPVLTLAGDRFLSHIGESIMQNTGLPAWIAVNADDYVARAVSHAGDLQRLAILRNGLRQQVLASPLFDAPRFARHFETALREMWRKRCSQQQEQPSI